MKCKACNRELPEGVLVCPYCGAEVELVPEYESPDMMRIRQKLLKREIREKKANKNGSGKKRGSETSAAGSAARSGTIPALLALIIFVLLFGTANMLITNSVNGNYGYLKTMAERAAARGDPDTAEYYVNRAASLREDSSDLAALVQEIDRLKTEDAYVQDS